MCWAAVRRCANIDSWANSLLSEKGPKALWRTVSPCGISVRCLGLGQHREPIAGAHAYHPIAPIALMGDDGYFLTAVTNGLGHRLVDIEAFNGFNLKMVSR